jgi:hypothetical protein
MLTVPSRWQGWRPMTWSEKLASAAGSQRPGQMVKVGWGPSRYRVVDVLRAVGLVALSDGRGGRW